MANSFADENLRKRFRQQSLAQNSWGVVLGYLVVTIVALVWTAGFFIVSWSFPIERNLLKVSGSFLNTRRTGIAPYTFVTDSGKRLLLGCDPESSGTTCLEKSGYSMRSLAGQHVTVGYFTVNFQWWKRLRRGVPLVIVTVDRNGHSLLSFKTSQNRLIGDLSDQRIKSYFGLPLVLFAIAVWAQCIRIARAKLQYKHRRSNDDV